jgi:membrane peptidoglycan carboxypeptidase
MRVIIVRLLVCGLVAGAVVAALAFPGAAVGGLFGLYVTNADNRLPASLQTPYTAKTTYVYANDGKTLLTAFYAENRKDVRLADVSVVMQQAIVAAEDARFYQHHGIDSRSVGRAVVANGKGDGTQQGASTLTMQYVRNVLKEDPSLTPQQRVDASADTFGRKIKEMRYAAGLEKRLSKQEILERYLNIAYFGGGAYGIYAASKRYFNKPASQLTLGEASLLAGLVQSPDVMDPIHGDRAAALARRGYVLNSMAGMKVISVPQAQATNTEPLSLHPTREPNNCASVPEAHDNWGFFCDYFRKWWDAQPAFGRTPQDREDALQEGGYTVVTTLDPAVQEAALQQSLSVYGYENARALPMAVVQPGTGRVLALAVNRHYRVDANPEGRTYPNSVGQLVAGGGGVNGYPAGSTFKLFTMLAALEGGKPLNTGFNARSPLVTKWLATGVGSCGGRWCPRNANPQWMDGYRMMWNGFGRSVNTYFVWLEEQIGPQKAVEMAQRLGITFRAESDATQARTRANIWGSFTLGVSDTTPLDMANAYAMLAADGMYCQPLPVLSIVDARGHHVSAANPACRREVSPDVARAATDAGRCPVGQQSAFGQCDGGTAPEVGAIFGPRPISGKTGSTEHNATETFVGFTPQLSAAAIAANPDSAGDYVGAGVASSVNTAVARTLAASLQGQPIRSFPAPSRAIAFGGR